MKKYILVALFSSLFLTHTALAAQNANGRLYCLSFRLLPASDIYGDNISLNSTPGSPDGEDELFPWGLTPGAELMLPGSTTYLGSLVLWDAFTQSTMYGTLQLELPPFNDLNNNHYPDFFEVALGVSSTQSSGTWTAGGLYGYNGTIAVTWSRTAGSRTGTCRMVLTDNVYGYYGTFNHTFEILEYTGPVSYTPGSNTVSGSINLAKTGVPTQTLKGPAQFVKNPANRFDELSIQLGYWTNSVTGVLSFTNHIFTRDAVWPTNYAGLVEFDNDFDPYSFYAYGLWVFSITDPNDANNNSIPDFSDDPSVISPPRRPSLSLLRTPTNLWLTIRGDTNHVHQVMEAPSVPGGSWSNVLSVTLTTDPQVVTLPLPSTTKFWRVLAQ